MGESGENTDEWITKFKNTLDKNNVSWGFWPYKKMDASSCLVTFERPEGYDTIIEFANGPRTSFADIRSSYPDRKIVEQALEKFLELCRFENCRVNEGYLNALSVK
jgi:endoglucanase